MVFCMVTVYDVNPADLITNTAKKLKTEIEMPKWVSFVKTGSHKDRPPTQKEWYWVKAASILRKVYTDGPVGVNHLRVWYGGKKNNGVKPEHFRKAGGKIIRTLLQNLEAKGYVKKTKKGRAITPEGQKFLDAIAFEVSKSG